ncbi:MAG: hypothetical protein H6579_04915 [Chitinophagales bacterium]|nr:hypothetical protein [Chitinophagales bacterium]
MVLLVLLTELGLRIFSPYKSYLERNGSLSYIAMYFPHPSPSPEIPGTIKYDENPEFRFAHSFNSLGYRDAQTSTKNFKAFILGDSFVQGIGTDSSNTIDHLIEQKIACKNCILNMGLAGSELTRHYTLLENIYSEGLHADYVLLNLNSTDINDIIFSAERIPELDFKSPSYVFQYAYGMSYLFRHFTHDILEYNWNLLSQKEIEELNIKIIKLIFSYIYKYDTLCKANHSKLIIVFQALRHECINKNYTYSSLISKLEAEVDHPLLVNLTTLFEEHCDLYYWPLDQHFNPAGYELYSTELLHKILLKEPSFKP